MGFGGNLTTRRFTTAGADAVVAVVCGATAAYCFLASSLFIFRSV